MIEDRELEFADEQAVAAALQAGTILPETWIKHADVESDWETVEELLPHTCDGGKKSS